jgi:hypothetical protein
LHFPNFSTTLWVVESLFVKQCWTQHPNKATGYLCHQIQRHWGSSPFLPSFFPSSFVCLLETRFCYVAQAGLKLVILLFQGPSARIAVMDTPAPQLYLNFFLLTCPLLPLERTTWET